MLGVGVQDIAELQVELEAPMTFVTPKLQPYLILGDDSMPCEPCWCSSGQGIYVDGSSKNGTLCTPHQKLDFCGFELFDALSVSHQNIITSRYILV